jgi:hypothetical protein
MRKICATGCKISALDRKAFEHYCVGGEKAWAKGALDGMINKAVKTIIRDWLPVYKASNTSVPTDPAILLPLLVAMPSFKPYNTPSPEAEVPERDCACDVEVMSGGFDIQDYEHVALSAFYANYEQTLHDLVHNKMAKRKHAFVKEHEQAVMRDKSIASIPSRKDALIALVTSKPEYKNRAVREAEEVARMTGV